ncbi:Ca(2+)-dependent cysteine protease [Coemansia brasiliensis]|uniref:Ca(2+)-dependent cysteine protease n=1 Tax=Coemansia brasiliensis TaxID=2650707 RepID=A0A9W8I6V8_9FUNG|nr:Ca(2+)-dependent cysteine protease [Coemansia brasiliensis]
MSFTTGAADRYQAAPPPPPPANNHSAYGTGPFANSSGYQGDVTHHPPPQPGPPENAYGANAGYGQIPPPLSAPVQELPPPRHYSEGYPAQAPPAHVTGQYGVQAAASHAYNSAQQPPPPMQQQCPPPSQQYAYSSPPSATEPYSQHSGQPQPPRIAPSASAPVVHQYSHNPYSQPPPRARPPPHANTYYQPPASQNCPPPQHHMPPPQQPPVEQYYSQAEQGYYPLDSADLQQSYRPPPFDGGPGYEHSNASLPHSQSGSYYGAHAPRPYQAPGQQRPPPPMPHNQPVVVSGPMHHPPIRAQHPGPNHTSPIRPPQHSSPPPNLPTRHASLRHQPTRHSPVFQQQSSPQPLSQSQAMLQRHNSVSSSVGLSGSRPHPDMQSGYAGQHPYRNSPTPVSSVTTAPSARANAAAYVGSAQAHPGGLRQSATMYDHQREMHVQQQQNMASLVGSMGAMSLARSSPLPQSATFSQPILASSNTMPMPYRGPPAQSMASASGAGLNSGPPRRTDLTGSTMSTNDNSAYPMWSNINANQFSAYQHQVPVQQSNLSGTKYALIIGINYYEHEYSQTSNINGAHAFKSLLQRKYGYSDRNIVLLSDDQEDSRCHPTYHNITSHIKRMMRDVRPNDAVFFYFCGFGRLPVQLKERRSEVLSGIRRLRCDYILPSDFEYAGAIDAEYLHRHLVHQLPPSARLTALFNCIVCETGLGVPYKYPHLNGVPVLTNAIAGSNLFEAEMRINASNGSYSDLSQRLENSLIQQQQNMGAESDTLTRIRKSSGDILVFGWDRDFSNPEYKKCLVQTPSNQLGSFWAAAMENSIRTRGYATFGDILGYLQTHTQDLVMLPFIACGRKIDMQERFVI